VTCREARGPDAAAGHVSTQGWPFLIGRTRTQDHRIVVIPGFMSRDLAAALRRRAVGEPLPPGSAFLRELRGAPAEPVAVVYRVWVPNAREYGLPGDGPLMDKHGRPILMAEGIALRGPAAAAAAAGTASNDLVRAHDAVVPAYQEFWRQGDRFSRAASRPFALARPGRGGEPLTLEAPAPPPSAAPERPAGPARPGAQAPPGAGPGATAARRRASRRVLAAVSLAAALSAAALAAAISLRQLPSSRAAATPAAAISAVCDGLLAGRPAAAYALTTPGYRRGTTEPRFAAMMLRPGDGPALECTGWLRAAAASGPVRATLVVAQGRTVAAFCAVSLVGRAGHWQVSGVTARPAPRS
jgi:hypothetical protein